MSHEPRSCEQVRAAAVQLFLELVLKPPERPQAPMAPEPRVLAKNLELCMYNEVLRTAVRKKQPLHWENRQLRWLYMTKLRSLQFNLTNPNNPQLLQRLLDGSLGPKRLVHMSHAEMFPEKWEALLEGAAVRDMRAMRPTGSTLPADYKGAFQCKGCRSWRTEYSSLQTRSSDEPMTNFIHCTDCDKRWKVN